MQKGEVSMVNAWQAIADARIPVNPLLRDPWLLWVTLALIAFILISAVVLVWLDRWRKRTGSERLSAQEQLASFRELYAQGQLSKEEFERIRATLAPQLRRELDLPAEPSRPVRDQKATAPKGAEPGSAKGTAPLSREEQSPLPRPGNPPDQDGKIPL
jgi:hypothetical protein